MAQFGFHLYDGKEMGSFVAISIKVTKGACFQNIPKNELVINRGFEEGSEVTTLSNTSVQNNLLWSRSFLSKSINSYYDIINWARHHADGMFFNRASVDLDIRGSWANCEFGEQSQYFNFPSIYRPNSSDNSNRYIGFVSGEDFYITLSDSVLPCKRYILRFDATMINTNNLNAVFNLDFQFVNFYYGVSSTAISVNVIYNGGSWDSFEETFVYKYSEQPKSIMGIKPTIISENRGYVLLDNLSLTLDTTYKPVEAHAGPDTIVCSGTQIGADSTATNGTPGYSYSWSPSTGLSSDTVSNPIVSATALTTTQYTVTVTDDIGCTAIDSVVVTINPKPEANVTTVTNIICNDSLTPNNGSISINVSNGTPPYSYLWNTNPVQTTVVANNLDAGNYLAIITDSAGCKDSLEAKIKKFSLISPEIIYNGKDTLCEKSLIILRTPTDFSFSKIKWSTGDETESITHSLFSVNNIFYFSSEDTNGCTSYSDTLILYVKPIPDATIALDVLANCPNLFVRILVSTENPGIDYDHYLWSNGDTTKSIFVRNVGIYSVTVTNDNGCFQVVPIPILCSGSGVPYDPNNKTVFPAGCNENGFIENQKLTYLINFQNIGEGIAKDVILYDTIDSDLMVDSLKIFSSSHNISNFSVDKNSRILTITFKNINLLPISIDTLGSMGNVSYSLLPFPNLSSGTEILNKTAIVFDQNEPIITKETINTIVDDINIYVDAGADKAVYLGYPPYECINLEASATGGLPPYSYQWSTGENSQIINVCPSQTTKYYVTATYSDGCPVAVDSVTVNVIDVRCGASNENVILCHLANNKKWEKICVDSNSVGTHLNNGDYIGPCSFQSRSSRLEINNIIENHDDVFLITPNPVSSKISFRLSLPYDSKIRIELYDVTGKKLATVLKANLTKGNMISFDYDVGSISESMFICRITTDNEVINRMVIKPE